jgi:hypothetical protein
LDVCVVFVVRTVVSNVKWHEGRKDLNSTKMDQRGKTPDRQKKNPSKGKTFSLLQNRPNRLWCPPSHLFNVYRNSFPGAKRAGRGVYHWPSSGKAKNEWRYTSTSLRLHGVERDKFLLLFFFAGCCLTGGKAARRWSRPLTSMCAEVKNEWSYISIYPYAFMACTELWIKKQPPTCTCWHFLMLPFLEKLSYRVFQCHLWVLRGRGGGGCIEYECKVTRPRKDTQLS